MVCITTAVAGYIDAKLIRINEFFRVVPFIKLLFHLEDMVSDVFFAMEVNLFSEENSSLLVIFIVAITFIIIPTLTTLGQLYHIIHKHWLSKTSNNALRTWLLRNTSYLMIGSILMGSSFASVELFNSNLFHLGIFSMGLSRYHLHHFRIKRVYSIILLENIPQLTIQLIFTVLLREKQELSLIVISSMILSIISIIVTIMTAIISKELLITQQYGVIKFDVTGKAIQDKDKVDGTYIYQIRQIRRAIGDLLSVNVNAMEIAKPRKIADGYQLKIYIYENIEENEDSSIQQKLLEQSVKGKLGEIIQQGWSLDDKPEISNIKYVLTESKRNQRELEMEMKMNQKEGNDLGEGELVTSN